MFLSQNTRQDDIVYKVTDLRDDRRAIIGPFGKDSFQLNFCMKNRNYKNKIPSGSGNDEIWPGGKYSLYSANMECPKGIIY